jgi:hypothetical protein
MGTRRRVFGFGDSEKLDAAKVPKITGALTMDINGHDGNIWQNIGSMNLSTE